MAYRTSPPSRAQRPVGVAQVPRGPLAARLARWYPLQTMREVVTGAEATPTGVQTVGVPLLGGMAQQFNGLAYIDGAAPGITDNRAFTVAAWATTDTSTSSGGGGGLRNVVSAEGAGQTGQFVIRYAPASNRWEARRLVGGGEVQTNGTGGVEVGRPYLLVFTWDGVSLQRFYIDGQLHASATNGLACDTTSIALTIGNDGGFNTRLRRFSGIIADVCLWHRALTPEEVRGLYQPATRWDLYAPPPPRRLFFDVGTGGAFSIDANTGTVTLTGTAADLLVGRVVDAGLGSVALTGTAADLLVGRAVAAGLGSLTVTGTAADLVYSGSGSKSLDAGVGAVVVSGTAATLTVTRTISAAAGTLAVSGSAATLQKGFTVDLAGGTLTLSGASVTLLWSKVLDAGVGSVVVAGTAVTFSAGAGNAVRNDRFVFGTPGGRDTPVARLTPSATTRSALDTDLDA